MATRGTIRSMKADEFKKPDAWRMSDESFTICTLLTTLASRQKPSNESGHCMPSRKKSEDAHQRSGTRSARRARRPLMESLKGWLEETLGKLSKKSGTARAVRYALRRWEALLRFCDDGRIEIDNNAAERSLRAVVLGRKNFLFAGSDAGGERAAAIYSLIATAKLNNLN